MVLSKLNKNILNRNIDNFGDFFYMYTYDDNNSDIVLKIKQRFLIE